MAIPFSTTTISVLRQPTAQFEGEPYQTDTEATRTTVASGIRAVVSSSATGRGRERRAGGEQSTVYGRLTCDPVDLRHTDWIKDSTTGRIWQVSSIMSRRGLGTDHEQAEIFYVEGLS